MVNVKIISLSREQTVSSGILARAVMSTHTARPCSRHRVESPMPSLWLNIFVIENSDISDKVISRTNPQRIWDGSVHCKEGSQEMAVASRLHRAKLLCEIHTELRSRKDKKIIKKKEHFLLW